MVNILKKENNFKIQYTHNLKTKTSILIEKDC